MHPCDFVLGGERSGTLSCGSDELCCRKLGTINCRVDQMSLPLHLAINHARDVTAIDGGDGLDNDHSTGHSVCLAYCLVERVESVFVAFGQFVEQRFAVSEELLDLAFSSSSAMQLRSQHLELVSQRSILIGIVAFVVQVAKDSCLQITSTLGGPCPGVTSRSDSRSRRLRGV